MKGRLLAREAITPRLRNEMLALMQRHFLGVEAQQFDKDLSEKNWVILLEKEIGVLCGFSTLSCLPVECAGQVFQVVYSGDTIVDRAAWGSSALARTWIGAINQLRRQGDPARRWFWLLITSGFRTYRFLPVFWREFWPRHDAATPERMQVLLDLLAKMRFGESFDSQSGIVRFAVPQVLRAELQQIPDGRGDDPHIRFFLQRNPGHGHGDELVCLCELSHDNLTAAGRRMVMDKLAIHHVAPCPVA